MCGWTPLEQGNRNLWLACNGWLSGVSNHNYNHIDYCSRIMLGACWEHTFKVTYTDNGPSFRDGCQEGVISPDPDDCSGYKVVSSARPSSWFIFENFHSLTYFPSAIRNFHQVCNHGKYVKGHCQSGTYWDQGLQVCVGIWIIVYAFKVSLHWREM